MSYLIKNKSNVSNVQAQKASSISTQSGTSSYQDLDSSDITYNCDSAAVKVVYEYTANFVYSGSSGVGQAKLVQYNTGTSAWEDVSSSHYVSWGFSTAGCNPRCNNTFKFVIDAWSGNKQLKLQWKVVSGGLTAHASNGIFDLSNTLDSSYLIKPFLIIYSIN